MTKSPTKLARRPRRAPVAAAAPDAASVPAPAAIVAPVAAQTNAPMAPAPKRVAPPRKKVAATVPPAVAAEQAQAVPVAAPVKIKKRDEILKLMRRKKGASLDELIAVTSWLPHTTRGAISTLRKKGVPIERVRRGDTSYYCIAAVAK